MHDVSISWNYILLSVNYNFGLGNWDKIERNDGNLLGAKTWLVDGRVRTVSHSVKQYARIVWASRISSLKVARYDCLPHCFSLTFQPVLFSVTIKKKGNFQLVFEPLSFELFLYWPVLFHDGILAGNKRRPFDIFYVI